MQTRESDKTHHYHIRKTKKDTKIMAGSTPNFSAVDCNLKSLQAALRACFIVHAVYAKHMFMTMKTNVHIWCELYLDLVAMLKHAQTDIFDTKHGVAKNIIN